MGPLKFNFMLSVDAQAGDQVDDLRDQIEGLGHEFVVSRNRLLPPPWFNLIVEGTSEATAARLATLEGAGYQLVILLTEKPTLVSAEGLVWNYHTSDAWMARADVFLKTSHHFCAAWCYAPGAAAEIRRFVPRAADIDLGWGRRFDASRTEVEPKHDFCFFGSPTPRRQQVLDAFRKRGRSVDIIPHSSSLMARDARIPNSRVVLDVKQYHWWDLASSVRYATALLCGRAVVAEERSWHAKGDWRRVIEFAPEGSFAEVAEAVLRDWRAIAESQRAALKRKPDTIAAAIKALPEPRQKPLRFVHEAESSKPPPPILVPSHEGAPILIDSLRGTNLVAWREFIYAVPQALGALHVDRINLARYPSIRCFPDQETARRALR